MTSDIRWQMNADCHQPNCLFPSLSDPVRRCSPAATFLCLLWHFCQNLYFCQNWQFCTNWYFCHNWYLCQTIKWSLLPIFSLERQVFQFFLWNKHAKLRRCVRRVHFAKYSFEEELFWKIQFEKIRTLYNGPETPKEWKSESVTYWQQVSVISQPSFLSLTPRGRFY